MKAYIYLPHKSGTPTPIRIERGTAEYQPRVVALGNGIDVKVAIYQDAMDALCAAWLKERERSKAKPKGGKR